MACNGRYKIEIQNGAILSVLEIFDSTGSLIDPPINHLPTDPDWANFILSVQNCDCPDLVECEGSGAQNIWTLFSKFPNPHPDNPAYVWIGESADGIHPVDGGSITGWNVFAFCSETDPGTDSNGHNWAQGLPASFAPGATFTRTNADPECESQVTKAQLTAPCYIIESREVCLEGGGSGYAVLRVGEASTVLLRIEDAVGQELVGAVVGDCECPCSTNVIARICLRGFDYQDLATWTVGDDTLQWEVIEDGVSQGISSDSVIAQDNGQKGSWYANLMSLVSSTSWNMSVSNDVASDNSGTDNKVTFSFEGPAGSQLQIIRQTPVISDVLTLDAQADGTVSYTFEEGGNNIASDMERPCM